MPVRKSRPAGGGYQPAEFSAVRHCCMARAGYPPPDGDGPPSRVTPRAWPADPIDGQWKLRDEEQEAMNQRRAMMWRDRMYWAA